MDQGHLQVGLYPETLEISPAQIVMSGGQVRSRGFLEQRDSASKILAKTDIAHGMCLQEGKLDHGRPVTCVRGYGIMSGSKIQVRNKGWPDLVRGKDLSQGIGCDGIAGCGSLDHFSIGVLKGLEIMSADVSGVVRAIGWETSEITHRKVPKPMIGLRGKERPTFCILERHVHPLVSVSVNQSKKPLGIRILCFRSLLDVGNGACQPVRPFVCIKGLIKCRNAKKVRKYPKKAHSHDPVLITRMDDPCKRAIMHPS